jgi:Fe-S cluster assembly iron-binding protein IscA
MDIADDAKSGDITVEKDGLKVFLEQEAYKLLSSATIDFIDEQGFLVTGMSQGSCCS